MADEPERHDDLEDDNAPGESLQEYVAGIITEGRKPDDDEVLDAEYIED